jgi:hypothetical protein
VVVIAQVKIRAHPCESNMFHGCCKMDWIMFVPPWCPKHISELQLHTSEDFEHVSFGKVREVGVLSCNVLECRVVWTMRRRANSADYPENRQSFFSSANCQNLGILGSIVRNMWLSWRSCGLANSQAGVQTF